MVSFQKLYFPLIHGEASYHGVIAPEAWVEFLPKFPCSAVEEGATEVEVNLPTRVALAFVFLVEFIATLVVVSVPESGMLALGSIVTMDPAVVVVTIDVAFVFEITESVHHSTERHHTATEVTLVVDLVVPTRTWVVVSLFVLFAV